jgi:formylglycine-generating enzyme required for sulfatase activity
LTHDPEVFGSKDIDRREARLPRDPLDRQSEESQTADMVRIPGGTFRMGSNDHYPEEAPVHRVTVDGFWIDRMRVTNRQFKAFVKATGHKSYAEIPPNPGNYPGALPEMIYAGSLVFTPPPRVTDLTNWGQWWTFMKGADWRHPYGPKSNINVLEITRSCMCRFQMRLPAQNGLAACTWPTPGKAPLDCTTTMAMVTSGPRR